MKKRIILALLASFMLTASTYGHVTAPIRVLGPESFKPVDIPPLNEEDNSNIFDFMDEFNEKWRPKLISTPIIPKIEPKSTPKPKTIVSKTGKSSKGVASWYCLQGRSRCTRNHPSGLYAAIRRDMLFLRGKTIKVCEVGTNDCVNVKIIDCNCGEHANLIDLYSDAFKRLAPLSAGRIKVVIRW